MQADSTESGSAEAAIDLTALARRLVIEGMPIQRVIGEEAGVSQSTVSRAIHNRLGDTPGARKLWAYAEQRLTVIGTERPIGDERDQHGTPTNASRLSVGQRAPRPPRAADDRGNTVVPARGAQRRELERRAIDGLRDYLEDRFDPLLVIEQLAVLRRAQDGARRARPEGRGRRSLRPDQ